MTFFPFSRPHLKHFSLSVGIYESADPGTVSGPALRLARIAQCYGSSYEIGSLGPSQASLEISSCAIWRCREQAREAGVQLTLDRPCTFCTEAVVEIARANGVVASFDLFKKGDNHGCAWSFARPGDQAYGVNGPTAQVPKCAGKAKVASTADPAGSGQNLASALSVFHRARPVLAALWHAFPSRDGDICRLPLHTCDGKRTR